MWQDSLLEKAEEEILSLYIYEEKWLRIPFASKRLIKWEFIYKLFFLSSPIREIRKSSVEGEAQSELEEARFEA